MKLNELFAAFGSSWPVSEIDTSWPPSTDGTGLAAQTIEAIEVVDLVTDLGADGTVTVTGTLSLVANTPPAPTRLLSHLFPSLGFIFHPEGDWTSAFRASIPPTGHATVQIDSLPLQVAVPADLLRAHPDTSKRGADAEIELSESAGDTIISRDFTFLLDAAGRIHIDPHLPISIGPCTLFGVPATAVHELIFIAAPADARAQVDWLVRDLDPGAIAFDGGALGFGGIELDWSVEGNALHDLRSRINLSEQAQVILEDLVLPSVLLPPVPQHGTIGVRRSLNPGESIDHYLSFEDAPIVVPLGSDGHAFLSTLFFRTPRDDEDWWNGLTIEGGIAWSDGGDGDFAISIGMIDGDVLRIGFEHSPAGSDLPVIHLDLWKITVDIIGVKLGVSLKELMKDSPDPGAAIQALTTIVIKEKPGEGSGAADAVRSTTEDGKPFEAALTDIGWDRGKLTGNMVMPHGAQLHLSRFVLEVHEMGLAYEHGATYFSISGGIREKSDPFEGGIWFQRLRGKIGGNPDAPGFQLGGIGLDFKVENVVEITAHGMYRDETQPDGTRIKEQGLGGGIIIYAGGNKWGLTVDLYWGSRIPPAAAQQDYLLFLIALFGAIPMGPLELRGIEALYATGLMPKIETGDREAGELKYYKWLKRARPTALPATRDLATSWTPTKDAWAFGLGLGISITGGGSVFQLKAFGAGFDSPQAAGLIIVVEFGMFESKKPLALGVFEYDFKRDAFVLLIQLDITLKDLIDNFPDDLDVKLGGTITIGNKPGLIALGRLNDPESWVGGKLELELSEIFQLKLRAGLCVEWQENEHVGGGFTFSLAVTGSMSVITLQGWGALAVLLKFMLTGTNDFVARLRFELGFAIILFGFLRFGISIELLAEWLAHLPNYFVFRVTFRFETPWFLPDVSYTVEATQGTLAPADRSVATSPLLEASGQSRAGSKRARIQRLDHGAPGEKTALASVNALGGMTGAWSDAGDALPLDATVEIDFSVMLADLLGIEDINPDLGDQVSGDDQMALTTRYELIGITMRRRPLAGGTWETVEELTSSSSPRHFRWGWDPDIRVKDDTAPKRLQLNGGTPFTVGIDNPLADAGILTANPAYPCCRVHRPDVAHFDFEGEAPGMLPTGFVRDFRYEDRGTKAPVRIHGIVCGVVAPSASGATSTQVGAFAPAPGAVVTVDASEDLAVAVVQLAVAGRHKARLILVAHDRDGVEVKRIQHDTGASGFKEVTIDPGRPFATLSILIEDLQREQEDTSAPASIALDWVDCITQRDRDRFQRESDRCSRQSTDGHAATVTFLARHEYEIALTTRVSVKHSATDWEATTITERVSFTTAGPPGLNETPEPGIELQPYIVSHAPGGRGLTYREESVHLVLSDALRIFGPGAGMAEADFRLPITIAIESAFDANPAAHIGKSSRTSADWFLAHRGLIDPWISTATLGIAQALTRDGKALRYRDLAGASSGTCPPDDVWIEQQPRVGVEPFDPSGRALWEALASYVAVMRLEGSPFVERMPFEAADISAFTTVSGMWHVDGGALVAAGACSGTFGDDDWDLYRVELRGVIGAGGEFGIVVLATSATANGVRAFVRRTAGAGGTLIVETTAGVLLGSAPIAQIGDDSALAVDVFADAVRCMCGDTVVSLPREDRAPGSCQLLATAASITSLRVHGIDMYRQPFRTSRYEGFAEHVGSCAGFERYDTGGTSEALASVLTRLGGPIAAAMSPEAADADREQCFSQAASTLAVPLREDPDRVHLTGVSGGTDRWLLLETPEPMDFSKEITLALSRRVVHAGIDPADRARLGTLIEAALHAPRTRFPLPGRRGIRRLIVPTGFRGILDQPLARKVAFRVWLDGKFLVVENLAIRAQTRVKAPLLSATDRALLVDVKVDLNSALHIIAWHAPSRVEWVPLPLAIIQNAPATHALILPSTPLPDGSYRLQMNIVRRWFDTIDPVGPENAYIDDATIDLAITG
jgi:hypothetical protein